MTIADRLAAKAKQELEISTPLSKQEQEDWRRLREQVGIHQNSAVSFIECLTEIRDRRLYREEYGTFDAYVAAELSFSKRHIDRLIHHNEVRAILGPMVPKLPESHARELVNVPPKKIPAIIKKADAKAKSEGRKREARDVKEVAAKVKPSIQKAEKPEKTVKEQVSLLKTLIKNHNAAMMRAIDDLQRIAPNKPMFDIAYPCFVKIHETMEKWK